LFFFFSPAESALTHAPSRYLTTKHACDPFIRNAYGETAYDVAVASYEINIADVLAQYEARVWAARGHDVYNPLELHLIVPITLHENQRLDLRFKSIAKSMAGAGKPQFTSKVLSRNDRRAPFGLPPSWEGLNPSGSEIPVFRSEVELPSVDEPFKLVLPPARVAAASSSSTRQSDLTVGPAAAPDASRTDRSHFWQGDWFIDLTPPSVDASVGWQYAQSFDDPPERWTPQMPAELVRLIEQDGGASGVAGVKWVRRRRWCRVMRRRLDRPNLGFVGDVAPSFEDAVVAFAERNPSKVDDDDDYLEEQPPPPPPSADYVEHARYLAGAHHLAFESDGMSVRTLGGSSNAGGGGGGGGDGVGEEEFTKAGFRKLVARLEAAITELRAGLLGGCPIITIVSFFFWLGGLRY
jgi:hypothetical protein